MSQEQQDLANNGTTNENVNKNVNEDVKSNISLKVEVSSHESENFLGGMSEKGKEFLNGVYNDVSNKIGKGGSPFENRLAMRIGVAYNQFWINKNEEKSSILKGKVDSINLRNRTTDESITEMKNLAKSLDEEGAPGSASLNIKIRDMEQSKIKLENRKDKLLDKLEVRDNKISLFTNKRDNIADKLIAHYEKKLIPFNEKLENLNSKKDLLEFVTISAGIKYEEQLARMEVLKFQKNSLENSLKKSGESEKSIKKFKAIKEIDNLINETLKKIENDKRELESKKYSIDKKIAKVDEKAQPYRDKKDKFIRAKNNRPIRVDVEQRQSPEEFVGRESVKSNPRVEEKATDKKEADNKKDKNDVAKGYESMVNKERGLNFEMGPLIYSYNLFIENSPNYDDSIIVDRENLFRLGKLSASTRVSANNFKKIIEQYYKINKVPQYLYSGALNEFLNL